MKYFTMIVLLGISLSFSCGGGGGGASEVIVPSSVVASFTPDKSSPDLLDVTLQRRSQSGDNFTVDVVITDVNDVFTVSFDLAYDGTLLDYLNLTEGNFLDEGGTVPTSFLVSEQSGRIIVGASRLGQVGGVNANGDEILMSIAFRVKKSGSDSVSFENNDIINFSGPPPIQGIEWFGGTAAGS
jgi:hypothetical protein